MKKGGMIMANHETNTATEQEESKIPDYWEILEKIAGNLEEWA